MVDLVPPGAWDTHIHVFDPERFPYGANRSYTPGVAQLSKYPIHTTGCKNIVIVHASVQGSSPEPLLDTLSNRQKKAFEGTMLRGLATIDPQNMNDEQLDKLHAAGVRGSRLHRMAWGHGAESAAEQILNDIRLVAAKTKRLGWVISIFCPLATWATMATGIKELDPRVRIVADHFGSAFPGVESTEDFGIFLNLIREKRIYVKISGFERLYHGHTNGIDALEPIARAIIEIGPEQIMFGTDWPHTGLGVSRQGKTDEQRLSEVEEFRDVPNAEHIRKLRDWVPDDAVWKKLFVSNAQKLFS